MQTSNLWILFIALACATLSGRAGAAEVLVSSDISVSTEWTANNTYNLKKQIYVLPGATLTIEAGTVVKSTANLGGSLAVTRGAKIYVNGRADAPVIMTSTNDDMVTWREAVNEWGNLTIMGRGLIAASHYGGLPVGSNTKTPTGLNVKQMEGLTAAAPGDPTVMYGGNDDNDDSGSVRYLSLRYGGKVIGLGNELNGLSLGAIGRATDIDHIEIMNNVDDGIEIWGGTVNLKYISIWNIGDDSLDVDQGWRGKAQFGLIVQGHSTDAAQGSGVGDNALELDGAEDSDAQPVTTASIYNFTVVGQPVDGDHGTAWRDNARVQVRNSIFMELGEALVKNDNVDGDGGNGYGYNGTLSWADTWTTPYTAKSSVNAGPFTPGAFNDPAVMYTAQTSGMLSEITDSVFYNNLHSSAYTEANARGVTTSGGSNAAKNNVVASALPIQAIQRGTPVVRGGKTMLPVTKINPTPANDARSSVDTAPADGFFTPAQYRGAFSPNASQNWLAGWSAADAFGFLDTTPPTGSEVLVNADISMSTTWTANNTYNLQKQIYVLPGATLTIEAGTVVKSTANLGGSLAVTRGAKIYVNGRADAPVIMTSTNDDMVTWREAVNEWGNLTIMGRGLIAASHYGGLPVGSNTKTPTGLNVKQMEGLTAAAPGDPTVMYGGNDDNDDSGSVRYLSLRYGGKVIGLGNELNGLSLGAIGRATDIDHIEIMNNVDDGIEIWGGTVNLKYISIWNIGDDSLDVDQGWRGKAQFGLIVQGHSTDAAQGSGVGDNALELDGAEDSDAQPVTTASIYNFTVVGQPVDGDHGTAWRDNARVQVRNSIFMELGEALVKNDNVDGDGGNGYGYNGTLSWADTWTTPYTAKSSVNAGPFTPGAFNDPAVMYTAQTSGMLSEITDSVFYNNLHSSAYTEANARGVTTSGGSNAAKNNVVASALPIQAIQRGTPVVRGGKTMLPVFFINPLPANDALVSAAAAPADGFFTPAQHRGAFAPDVNWLRGWSAADAFGFMSIPNNAVQGGVWSKFE